MKLRSLFAHTIYLLLIVILFTACTPTTPVPPTSTSIPPTDTPFPPTSPTTRGPVTGPAPRGYFGMTYASKPNRVILFGGKTEYQAESSSYKNDTWVYNLDANTWMEVKPPAAPAPRSSNLVYDAESDRIILYCGFNMSDPSTTSMDDIWAYDFNTNTWMQMLAKGPAGHHNCKMAYDSESDRVILFGGIDAFSYKVFQDTWAYDFNSDSWTEMKPDVSPPGRYAQFMTYDSKADRIIMWSGSDMADGTSIIDNDVWTYDYNTNTWEGRKAEPAPAGRCAGAIAYNALEDRIILYGGGKSGRQDMWAYDYSLNTWSELTPSVNPGWISWNEMVYIPGLDRLLLFGGITGAIVWGKTWLYDFSTNTWTEVILKP